MNLRLYTQQDQIMRHVIEQRASRDMSPKGSEYRDALKEIDYNTITLEQLNAIRRRSVGYLLYAQTCDCCDKESWPLVHYGDEPAYDSRWQFLCRACLYAGLELLK